MCAKESKLHKGKLVLNHQQVGQNQSGDTSESQVRGCENWQLAKFTGCQILQPPKFHQFAPPTSIDLLRISSDLIMSLRIRLRFNVFESN